MKYFVPTVKNIFNNEYSPGLTGETITPLKLKIRTILKKEEE